MFSALLLGISLVRTADFQIHWSPSLAVAEAFAKRTGRPLMIVVTTNHNGGWHLTQSLGFLDVAKMSSSFSCVQVSDVAALSTLTPVVDPDGASLAFATAEGKVVVCAGGFLWDSDMIDMMNQASWTLRAHPKPGSLDSALQLALGGRQSDADRILLKLPAKPNAKLARAILAEADWCRARRQYEESIPLLQKSAALAVTSLEQVRARLRLISSLFRTGQLEEAIAEAKAIAARHDIQTEQQAAALSLLQRLQDEKSVVAIGKA